MEERKGKERNFDLKQRFKGDEMWRTQDECYPESHRTDIFVLQSMSLQKSSGHRSKKCSKDKNA